MRKERTRGYSVPISTSVMPSAPKHLNILFSCLIIIFGLLKADRLLSQQRVHVPLQDTMGGNITRSLIHVPLNEIDDGIYRGFPSGMEKKVLTRFTLDPIQASYQKYLIDTNDHASWKELVKKQNIDSSTVFSGKVLNSMISIFSGIDSLDRRVIVLDINGNHDFSDDEIYIVPISAIADTTFSLVIPFQVYENRILRDTLLRIGLIPIQKVRFSDDLSNAALGLTFYNAVNRYGKYIGKKMDYEFNLVPPLTSNWNYGKIPSNNPYRMNTLDKEGKVIRSTLQSFTDTIHFDGADWRIIDHNKSEIIFEIVAFAESGYNIGQIFNGLPLSRDFISGNFVDTLPAGKFVLIDFWGTWCTPCIEGIPDLIEFRERYKDQVTMISVLYDQESKIAEAKKIIMEQGMDWVHVWDDTQKSEWVRPMGIKAFPGFIFVGKDNSILINSSSTNVLKEVADIINQNKEL